MNYKRSFLATIFFLQYFSAMEQKQSVSILEKIHFNQKNTKVLTLTELCCKSILFYLHKNPALTSNQFILSSILDNLPIDCIEQLLQATQPVQHAHLKHIKSLGAFHLIQGIVSESRVNPTKLMINTLHSCHCYSNRRAILDAQISDDQKYVLLKKTKQLTLFHIATKTIKEAFIDACGPLSVFSIFHNDKIYYLNNKQLFCYAIKTQEKKRLLESLCFSSMYYLKTAGRLLLCDYNKYRANLVYCLDTSSIIFSFSLPKHFSIETVQSPAHRYDLLVTKSKAGPTVQFKIYTITNVLELQSLFDFQKSQVIAFNNSKEYLAAASDDIIQIFNTYTGQQLSTHQLEDKSLSIKKMWYEKFLCFTDIHSNFYTYDMTTAQQLQKYLQEKRSLP